MEVWTPAYRFTYARELDMCWLSSPHLGAFPPRLGESVFRGRKPFFLRFHKAHPQPVVLPRVLELLLLSVDILLLSG